MPVRAGGTGATVEKLSETSARIRLGEEAEVVNLGTGAAGQAAVERGGERQVLLEDGAVAPWAALEFKPAPPSLDQGAR